MGANSLPKTVTRQCRDCDLNPGPSAPESSTLTTRLYLDCDISIFYLTIKAPRCNALNIKCGVAIGPTVIGAGTRHLPPSRIGLHASRDENGQVDVWR